MTERFHLLIDAIHATDLFLVQMFLFSALAVLAYPVLGWLPEWMRRSMQWLYLALMLVAFVATVYLSSTLS